MRCLVGGPNPHPVPPLPRSYCHCRWFVVFEGTAGSFSAGGTGCLGKRPLEVSFAHDPTCFCCFTPSKTGMLKASQSVLH